MISEKNEIASTTKTLPNDSIYALYLKSKIQKSENDIKHGRVMTIEESKERMRKKYAGFNI